MAFHQLVRLSILTVLVYQVATESRHGPSNPETQRVDALFDTFSEASSDSLRQFKRQFDKSFERQSQLLQFDGTDKPDSSNGFIFKIHFPGHQLEHFNNKNLINYPMPNLRGNNRITQLLVTLDYHNHLNVFQFRNHTLVTPLEQPFLLNIDPRLYVPTKILSLVQDRPSKKVAFRLFVLVLFKKLQNVPQMTDKLAIYLFDGEWNTQLAMASSLRPTTEMSYRNGRLYDTQSIEVHEILDFDLLQHSYSRGAHKNVYYLSTITMSAMANSKFDLTMLRLDEKQEKYEFNKMVTFSSDHVLNGNRVKMARLDSAIHMICSHFRNPHVGNSPQQTAISLYRYNDIDSISGSITLVSSLKNDTLAGNVMDIRSWPSSNYLLFTLPRSVEVYQIYEYSSTIEWRDSMISPEPLRSFGFAKIPSMATSPPMMISTDGLRFTTYRKISSDFFNRILQPDSFPRGYEIFRIEVFNWANRYYIWTMFQFAGSVSVSSGLKSFGRIYVANLEDPENSEDIRTLDHCIFDLYSKIEEGIKRSLDMEKRSEDLLVIVPSKPVALLDVTVLETLKVSNVPKAIIMELPNQHRILHANRVTETLGSVQYRLQQLQKTMHHSVVMRSVNQTIFSPMLFTKPIRIERLKIDRVVDEFFLNDVPFEVYSNNTLLVTGDQTFEYGPSGALNFKAGLQVDELNTDKVNDVLVKQALFVNNMKGTQMVSGEHSFRTVVDLLNGTTAPSINNIKLYDLFQDVHHPVQLFRHPTHFQQLSVPELFIDTTLNDINLKQWESEIVWLENDAIKVQELSGLGLQFVGGVMTPKLHVEKTINHKLDVDKFILTAAKTNQELTLKGPVIFHTSAYAHKDVHYSGLLNGNIDLLKDVILLHSDQDFSQLPQESIVFDSTIQVKNFTMALLNGHIRSQDFVLRSELILEEFRQKVTSGKESFSAFPNYPKLWNKYFANNLIVKNNIDFNDRVLINGVDLSELYRKLDTVFTFNTPLEVDQIEVGGNMATVAYNEFSASIAHQIMKTRLSKYKTQIIHTPVTYMNGKIKVQNLMFNFTSSGLTFPRNFVRRNGLDPVVNIFGAKYFTTPISTNDIHLGTPAGTINGHKVSKLYSSMVKNDSTSNKVEMINGLKQFGSITILGNLVVEDGLLNEFLLNKAVLVAANQQVLNMLVFDKAVVKTDQIKVKSLGIKRSLSNYNFPSFLSDLVLFNSNQPMHLSNKHFSRGILLNELHLNMTGISTVGSVNLAHLLRHAVTVDEHQLIDSSLHFGEAYFEQITNFTSIQNLTRSYFESVILKSASPIHIYGAKVFQKDIFVRKLHSTGQLINRVFNLTHITRNTLMRYGDQIVTQKHVFLRPIRFHNVQINPLVRVSDRKFSDFVQLNTDIHFKNDIIFEHLIEVQNFQVTGLVDQCNLTHLAQNSIMRNPDLTFNLKSVYAVPILIVTQNIHLKNRINDHNNFIGNIALRDDHRPLKVDLVFTNDVVASHLTVNSLLNQKFNLTHLFHDAVYVHVPQVITGRKVFHRPLKIYGFVSQAPGKQLQLGGHMNSINVSRLFTTTVMTDRTQAITGRKHFLGRIRFTGPLTLRAGLNGVPVPEGYHLTHTDEVITGETYFTKRVHVNQNLNARLVNHVNLTQFVNNLIYVQPVKSIPRSQLPMDATSVVTFEDGVYIKNLTIRNRINDIKVEDLLHQNSNVQVNGYKIFQKPIRINGNLQLGTVNSIDFEQDLKREWIDTRRNARNVLVNVTGTLIIKRPTHMDHLNIAEKLNSFTFDQFDPRYFANLNQTVYRLNTTLKREMYNLSTLEENLQEFVKVDYLNELRYFVMIQNFAEPVLEFFALSYDHFSRTDNLFVIRSKMYHNTTHSCTAHLSQYYEMTPSQWLSRSKTANLPSLMRRNTPDSYRIGKIPFSTSSNLKVTVVHSISKQWSDESAIIYSLFGQKSICTGKKHRGRQSDIKISHMFKFFSGRYSPDYTYPTLQLPIVDNEAIMVKRASMFSSSSLVKFLVLLYEDALTQNSLGLDVIRIDLNKSHSSVVQSLRSPYLDFDLIQLPGSASQLILLSLVQDFIYSPMSQFKGTFSSSTVLIWDSNKMFQPSKQFSLTSTTKLYSRTKFFHSNNLGTLLLLSTVRQRSDVDLCMASPESIPESFENFIDVFRLGPNGFSAYQRINLGSPIDDLAAGTMDLVEVGKQVYLFTLSQANSVHMFLSQSSSHFFVVSRYRVAGVSTLRLFWNANTLYLALGSHLPDKSQLLAALLSHGDYYPTV